jgi:hypothetical protein
MRGAMPTLPHTSSWRGCWLSTGTTLPLELPYSYEYEIFGIIDIESIIVTFAVKFVW